jgi:hypothetical protein
MPGLPASSSSFNPDAPSTPLPAPAKQDPSDYLYQAAAAAAPGAPAEVVAAAAKASSTPEDAADNAMAASQYSKITGITDALSKMTIKDQQDFYQGASASTQSQLKAAGYQPPPAPHSSSIFGSITGALGDVAKDAGHVISDATNNAPVHDVLNAVGSPLRAAQHVFRAADVVAEGPMGSLGPLWGGTAEGGAAGQSISSLFSVKDWAHAWDATTNGNKYIQPVVQNQVKQQYGSRVYGVALKLAQGTTPQQILNAAPASQRQALATYLQSNPDIAAATQMLNNGKISLGRAMVGAKVLDNEPTLGRILSGTIDATFDWFADPVNVGTTALQSARAAQFIVRDAQDVHNIFHGVTTASSVNRWAQTAVDHINAGDMSGFRDFAPKYQALGSQLNDLRQAVERPLTVDDVESALAGNVAMKSLLTQNPIESAGLHAGGAILPHLTMAGEARLAVKGTFQKVANWAEEYGADVEPGDVTATTNFNPVSRLVNAGGELRKSFMTLVPNATDDSGFYHFDPSNPNGIGQLRDVFNMLLPTRQAGRMVNQFFAATDEAGRRIAYLNAMHEMGLAAGYADGTPELDQWMSRFASDKLGAEQGGGAVDVRSYSHAANSNMIRPGTDEPYAVGVVKSQMADSDNYPIPDFRTAWMQANKTLTMRAYNAAINNQFVNSAMAGWRAATLAHFGFGLRVAADEGILGLLRLGPTRYFQALVNTGYGSLISHWDPDFIEQLREGKLYERWMGDLAPEQMDLLRGQSLTFNDDDLRASITTEHSLATYKRAFAHVAEKTAPPSFRRYFPDLVKYSNYSLPRKISMIEEGFDGRMVGKRLESIDPQSGKRVALEFRRSGNFMNYDPAVGQQYRYVYQKALSDVHSDPWAGAALSTRDMDTTDRLNSIADKLQEDPDWRSLSIRSKYNRAGLSVENGQITERQAALDHAEVLANHVDHLITAPDGTEIPDLARILTRNAPISMKLVESIPQELLPESVSGPEMVQVMDLDDSPKYFQRANNWFFQKVIGPQVDGLVRQPLFWDAYVKGRESIQPWVDQMVRDGQADVTNSDLLAHQVATDRAIRQIAPYVHNPELKSQFSTITRNLSPFWFAQEQMYKRWMRSIAFAPQSVRQMQLIYGGLTQSGFVTTDPETGAKVFMYPVLPQATRVITDALGRLGVHVNTSLTTAWEGQFTGLTPALQDSFNLPSGPLVAIPLHELGVIDPHMAAITNAADNGFGGQSALSQVLPTTINRILDDAFPETFDASTYASAQMSAIKYLEASGQGMGTPATNLLGSTNTAGPPLHPNIQLPKSLKPGDYVTDSTGKDYVYQPDGSWQADTPQTEQAYIERIRNTARIIIVLKSVYGFFTPASPTAQINPQLSNDLTSLLNQTDGPNAPLTYDEAITAFLAAHPDASPYTVATTSTSDKSAYLPATTGTYNWLNQHSTFINAHPDAALYFLPTSAQAGSFSDLAYQAQIKEGFRTQDTPSNFYNQVIYDQAANIYFATEDQKNAAISGGQNKSSVDQVWDTWSASYLQANPIFANQLDTADGVDTRNNIMTAVGDALNDSDPTTTAPESSATTDIKQLYNSWLEWQNAIGDNASSGSSISASLLDSYNDLFANWASNFAAQHPDVQSLYNAAVRPAISTTLTEMAAASAAAGSSAGGALASGSIGSAASGGAG